MTALVIVAWKFGGGDAATPTPPHRRAASAGCRPGSASSGAERGRISRSGAAVRRAPSLFQGTLRPGDAEFLIGKRFWLAVRRPAGVRFELAGKPVVAARRVATCASSRPRRRRARLSRPRAVIVVTGSELVRGERTDLNGPFLAREALRLGLEPARIAIVGDEPAELEAVLRAALDEGDAVLDVGRARPDARRPHGRARRARARRRRCTSTPSSRRRSKASRARRASGCGATTPTSRRA